jgi:hypothetical protein
MERPGSLNKAAVLRLARSIETAAACNTAAWGLTAREDQGIVRLNVGKVEVLVYCPVGGHFLVCLRKSLPPERSVAALGGKVRPGGYKSLPDPVIVTFPGRSFARGYDLVIEAHRAAISAAARHKGYSWWRSHSSEALRAVRRVSGRDLPDPQYAKDSRQVFLLTWKPDSEDRDWRGFPRPGVAGRWRCWNKSVSPGDRLLWLRQGRAPRSRGLFAAGWATSIRRGDGRIDYRVADRVSPDPTAILPLSRLYAIAPTVPWGTQRSGILLESKAARAVEDLWDAFIAGDDPADVDEDVQALEGELRVYMATHRLRERALRDRKIAQVLRDGGRLRCQVRDCGFDFEQTYGELGRGFAIVHHLVPLACRRAATRTRLSELAIVCANCHTMIHLGGRNRTLEAVSFKSR